MFRDLELKGDAIREKMLRPGDGDDNADGDPSEPEGMPRCQCHVQVVISRLRSLVQRVQETSNIIVSFSFVAVITCQSFALF